MHLGDTSSLSSSLSKRTQTCTPVPWPPEGRQDSRSHSARRYPFPKRQGDESAGKKSHRNRSSSPARVKLLQPLLPHPQKRRWPATYSRSQTPESSLLVHLTNIAQAPTSLGLSILYGCQVSTYGTTLRPPLTLWLSLCLVYSLDSPGSYSHMSLGVESFHVIARRDCTCSHTSVFDPVRVKYRKGTYLVTIVTLVLWDMERVLRSPSVTSFKEIWDAAAKGPFI